jgi:hypothetical protein
MPWAAAATVAGSLITSSMSSNTANQSAGIADPFASQRPQYQGQLSALMADPSSIKNTPGYQFQFDQGMQALERVQAGQGAFHSGQTDTAAIQFGQGLAETSFNNWENILATLSGATTGNPGTAGGLYSSNMGNANSAIQSGLGSLFSGLGNITSGGGGGGGGGGSVTPPMSIGNTTYTGGGNYNPGLTFGQ